MSNTACIFYFVHLNSAGEPLPGTMFAKPNNKIDNGYKCVEARLTGQIMTPPAGYVQCFPASGLRYWYQVDRHGNILPNSLIAVRGTPKHVGGTPCRFLEYKLFSKAS